MLTYLFTNPIIFVIWAISLVIAVTIHEFAHAWTADKLGDPTPRLMGRVTLNPLAHLDPLGTLMMLLARFGWGKPVQFDPFNLENPRRDAALISLAGPASNFILATVLALLVRLPVTSLLVDTILEPMITVNIILAIFNLVPVHPLDGFKIVSGLLPEEYADQWESTAQYGIFILLALILPLTSNGSLISQFLGPLLDIIIKLLLG